MKKSQITSCEEAQHCANSGCTCLHAKRAKISKAGVKRIMMKLVPSTTLLAFAICFTTSIICMGTNIKAYYEEREVIAEAYTIPVEESDETFSANYRKVKFEEFRAPLAFAEAIPQKEVALYLEEECYEVVLANEFRAEVVAERFTVEHQEVVDEITEEETLPEEYKPIKLPGYNISAEGPYERYIYILSEEDMMIIAKVVWAEARGECYKGKVAVAACILNRYFSDDQFFSRESILHTATQSGQFASIWDVTESDLNTVPECLDAVKDACRGWDPTREVFEEGALYFYAPKGVSGYQARIREGIKVMVIGNHNFHYDFVKVNG